MSRFFDQTSSSESESESDNGVIEQTKPKAIPKVPTYDSDEDKKQRVVIPEKARRIEEINGLVKQLKNAKNIRDVVKSMQVFEDMVKAYDKCKRITDSEGHFKQYIRAIAELEAHVDELWKDNDWKKSASKNNAGALGKLRQRIRKYNKEFEPEIADFKANPDNYPEEEKIVSTGKAAAESDEEGSQSEKESSDEESEDEKPKSKPKVKVPKDEDDEEGSDEDSEDWGSSDSEETSSEEEIDYDQGDVWKAFLKTNDKPKDKATKKEKTSKKPREKIELVESDQESEKPKIEKKLFGKDDEINHESVFKKLNEICSGRGRKGTDRYEQIELIKELRSIAKQHNLGPAMDVKILFNLIAISFDYNSRVSNCMKHEVWTECLKMLEEIIGTLAENADIQFNDQIIDEEENLGDKPKPYKLRGCVLTMADRLYEEFIKILQQCDAHGSEYVERLKDEPKVCQLFDNLQGYVENAGDKQQICRIYLKKVENLYYKYDKSNEKQSAQLVDKLCKFIYQNDSTDRLRTKAILCHIYHNALHDRWFEARDLILMSHLQESIDNSDIPLQILYNRTMVQVGLCAFRVGNIKESHAALLDIQVGNRAKELLAQGVMVQRNIEKSKEQEIKERQRLIPFHMHINLELLECVYLVSAMLIEIPYMSSRDYETKKRLISKQFHYQLKFSERQPVVGPPENMREHVVAASRAMRNGDWRACINYLINDKMNAKVWDLMPQSSNVKVMLAEKVKEESLRTYLFRYSTIYESISIENLALMFELPRTQVYSNISKMIINEDLMASLDEPTQTVVMHRTEPTKLQTLAQQLSEKITNLMDQTERMIQIKGGEMSAFLTRNQQGNQSQQNQQSNRDHKQQPYKQNRGQRNKDHHHNQQHRDQHRDHNRDHRDNRDNRDNRNQHREQDREERQQKNQNQQQIEA